MTEKEEKHLQLSNTCWICKKLIEDEKVRDHYDITGKCRPAAHCSCSINLQLAKKSSSNISQLKRLWQSFDHKWTWKSLCENWCYT